MLLAGGCGGGKKAIEAQVHYKLGASHLSEGNIQPAFVEFQKAVELDPNSKDVHNAIGIIYLRLKDHRKAEESFKRAIRIDSDYSEAYNNLCFLYYSDLQWKKAIEKCKRALKNRLYETPEKAFFNLGRAYYRLGMYNEAIEAYTEAIKRFPGFYIAYYALALSHNALADYGQASTALTTGIGLDPRFEGDKAKAEASFNAEKATAEEPKDIKDLLDILHY